MAAARLSLLAMLLLPALFMQAQVDLVLTPAASTVSVGDDFSVTLQINAGTTDFTVVQTYLDFDPALVTVNSV